MPYATVQEYLDTYGERETGLLTNTTAPQVAGGPTIDEDKVEIALSDASDEIDGYVARRYATPLQTVPTLVKGWCKALARLRLAEGTGRVSDAIKEAADRATRQLEQLVAGRLDLPVPLNTEPAAQVGTGSPMVSGDRATPLLTNCALDRFTAPFTGYGDTPRWLR